MLQTITDFGDSALLLPASCVLLVYFCATQEGNTAAAFAAGIALSAGITALLKVSLHACGPELPALGLHSPSGHAALSTTFYGCAALLLAEGRRPWQRRIIGLAATALLLAIAISRLMLHAHTLPEVLAGTAIGLVGLLVFGARGRLVPVIGTQARLLLAGLAMVAILTHGQHINAEAAVVRLARQLQTTTNLCQATDTPPNAAPG